MALVGEEVVEAGKKFQAVGEVVADMDTADEKEGEGEEAVDFLERHNAVKMMMNHMHRDDN